MKMHCTYKYVYCINTGQLTVYFSFSQIMYCTTCGAKYRSDENALHIQICLLYKYRSADSVLLFFQIIYCTTSGAKYRSDDSVMDCAEPRTDCWQLRILHSPLLLQLQSFYYCNPVPLSVLFCRGANQAQSWLVFYIVGSPILAMFLSLCSLFYETLI